jgi:hypothetical protein
MNVSQIIRLGCFNADAIKKAGTLSPFVTDGELLAWANEGNRKLELKLRQTRANYFTRMKQSTDTVSEKIMGIEYTPSQNLPLAVGTNYATLPPDFQELNYLKILTSGYEGTPMTRRPYTHSDFRQMMFDSQNRNPGVQMFFDIIGERQLIFVPRLSVQLDIELGYVARTKRLFYYNTGSMSILDTTSTMTGVGTRWAAGGPFDSAYLDCLFTETGSVPVPDPSLVYDGVNLARVKTIDGDTKITLAAAKIGTLPVASNYLLSSVPVYGEEYHYNLADYIAYKILSKAGDPTAQRTLAQWPDNIGDMITTSARRQNQDHETIEDWNPWS